MSTKGGRKLISEGVPKEEKEYQHKMVKLESLKKSDHFKTVLKGKKIHTNFFNVCNKKFLKSHGNF